MAGGKLSPRQKMINLMYLVFIAMLALNMSKEVLSAFGSINEKLDSANNTFDAKNTLALNDLKAKAGENEKFAAAAVTAEQASKLSDDYYNYLESQKTLLLSEVDDKTDYETMDKSQFLDETYYKGGKLTPEGQQFIDEMDKYRNGMLALVQGNNPAIAEQVKTNFSTDDIVSDGKGAKVKKDYISYHFVGFPTVASLTKMTQIQNDIKVVENELLGKLLSGNLKALSNINEQNYETVMNMSKGAFYTGETFDGILSLGRVDETTKPKEVRLKLDGRDLSENQYEFVGGRVQLKVGAGSVGNHKITGVLVYDQEGEDVEVKVEKEFTTIDKPNSATIAADKMNVVYRGVDNPMTITFAGIQDRNVRATATGLSQVNGSSYVMRPGTGKEVTINVTGTFDGGKTVSDSETFRIKGIPRPVGTMRNDDSGFIKMSREALGSAPVGAALPDFDFDLNLKVNSFKFKAGDAATVTVQGNRLNDRAKAALRRAKKGSTAQIFDIKASISGNSGYKLPKVSSVLVELTN